MTITQTRRFGHCWRTYRLDSGLVLVSHHGKQRFIGATMYTLTGPLPMTRHAMSMLLRIYRRKRKHGRTFVLN